MLKKHDLYRGFCKKQYKYITQKESNSPKRSNFTLVRTSVIRCFGEIKLYGQIPYFWYQKQRPKKN